MRPMTSDASCGVSPAALIRRSLCSVMPEIVCTIEVNAPIGITYRAVSIAFFSASRSIPFNRSTLTRGVTYLNSFRMAKASSFSSAESSA